MISSTMTRVESHTAPHISEQIWNKTESNITFYAKAGPEAIQRRLEELDREWDIERALETNAASIILIGVSLGVFVKRKWLALPAVAAGFLLQHAIQGWCPPINVLRRLGFRTMAEINSERYALKALRGDFEELSRSSDKSSSAFASAAIQAVRM